MFLCGNPFRLLEKPKHEPSPIHVYANTGAINFISACIQIIGNDRPLQMQFVSVSPHRVKVAAKNTNEFEQWKKHTTQKIKSEYIKKNAVFVQNEALSDEMCNSYVRATRFTELVNDFGRFYSVLVVLLLLPLFSFFSLCLIPIVIEIKFYLCNVTNLLE